MSDTKWRNLGIVLRRVLRTPFALSALGLGVLWAMLMHNSIWGVLGLGAALAAVAAYAAAKLQDETFIREAVRESRQHERQYDSRRLEFRLEQLDVESRVRMKATLRLQQEIAEEVESSPIDEVAVGLADTVRQTEALVERGLELAQKRRDLLRYLNRTDDGAIRSRISSLEARLEHENNPTRKAEIETALAATRQELDDYTAIESAAARILSELDSIEYSFSSLRARLVRIKSSDLQEWVSANTELQTELGGLNTAVDSLERSINEALSIQGNL